MKIIEMFTDEDGLNLKLASENEPEAALLEIVAGTAGMTLTTEEEDGASTLIVMLPTRSIPAE